MYIYIYIYMMCLPTCMIPVTVKKHSSGEEDPLEARLSEHQIRAGMQCCCWIAWPRLGQKECFFRHRFRTMGHFDRQGPPQKSSVKANNQQEMAYLFTGVVPIVTVTRAM